MEKFELHSGEESLFVIAYVNQLTKKAKVLIRCVDSDEDALQENIHASYSFSDAEELKSFINHLIKCSVLMELENTKQ